MAVMRMGYMHVRVTDLAEAKQHYGNTVGLYQTLEQDGRVYYKGWDEWDHHSVVIEEGGVGYVKAGWKCERPEDVADIETKAIAFGYPVEKVPRKGDRGHDLVDRQIGRIALQRRERIKSCCSLAQAGIRYG